MGHPSDPQAHQISQLLLRWYAGHSRRLPWRDTREPYHIWVSEVMLQQTQVERVREYYQAFLTSFPTMERLSRAPLDQVLKAWEGLGYYARARNLHRTAQIIMRSYGGKIPDQREELLKLPGIGRYTASAILSIAFGRDELALDANIRRVLCRLFALREDPRHSETETKLEKQAHTLLPTGHAGCFNQALMDLGATICISGKPRCHLCALRDLCEARRLGIQTQVPARPRPRAKQHREAAVGIIWRRGRILITQRPEEGLLGGLWEFPGGKRESCESLTECLEREILEETGMRVRNIKRLVTIKHSYSHFRATIHAFECEHANGRPRARGCTDWAWIKLSDLRKFAFPSANQKIIAILEQEHKA